MTWPSTHWNESQSKWLDLDQTGTKHNQIDLTSTHWNKAQIQWIDLEHIGTLAIM